jgi:hypothetical protein
MKQCGKGKNDCSLSIERYWMPNKRLRVKKGGNKKQHKINDFFIVFVISYKE